MIEKTPVWTPKQGSAMTKSVTCYPKVGGPTVVDHAITGIEISLCNNQVNQVSIAWVADRGACMNKPNILIVMTDHQRADTVHPGSRAISPNVKRLAEKGITLTNAF